MFTDSCRLNGKAPLETIVTFLVSLSPDPSTDTSLLPVCADEAGSAVQRVLRSTSTALRSLLQHGVHWSPSTLERPTLYLRRAAATAAANQQVRLSNFSCKPTSRGQRPQPCQAIKANLISRPSKSSRSSVWSLFACPPPRDCKPTSGERGFQVTGPNPVKQSKQRDILMKPTILVDIQYPFRI